MSKIRVLVCDDHPAFREGLCRLLGDEEDIEIVAKATDGEETVRLAKELQPNVALIDIAMPKLRGIDAAKQIKETCPDTAILIISAYDYEAYFLACLRAGVAGFLLKDAPLNEIVSAVRMVHSGKTVFGQKAAGDVLSRLATGTNEHGKAAKELHPREIQVLKLAAKGISNREIAKELVISERTVQTHLVNIFRKLGVTSRTEAVLCALKRGWLTIDELP